MSIDLSGQVAVVTGGSRGIGREVARAFAVAGATVAVTARDEAKLAETVAIIEANGGTAHAFAMDVADTQSVADGFKAIHEQLGAVDVLVNNAGVGGSFKALQDITVEEWWYVQEVNVKGVFACTQAVLPKMIARGSGRIINMGSFIGIRPTPDAISYSVSKAALMRLTDSIALAVKDKGVQVFVISPGMVKTDMTDAIPFIDEIPEEAFTPIEKSGELCVKLASGVADQLTGRMIHASAYDFDNLLANADSIVENDELILHLKEPADN